MATTTKKSKTSPTPKSKAATKSAANARTKSSASAKKKSTPLTRKVAKPAEGIISKGKDAVVEVVATLISGAITGAAEAGTNLVEGKTGSDKKSVKSKAAGTKKTPAKKRTAAAK